MGPGGPKNKEKSPYNINQIYERGYVKFCFGFKSKVNCQIGLHHYFIRFRKKVKVEVIGIRKDYIKTVCTTNIYIEVYLQVLKLD